MDIMKITAGVSAEQKIKDGAEVKLGLAAVGVGLVIPEHELQRTVIYHGHGKLVRLGVLHPSVEVAQRVVGRSGHVAREGQHRVVPRVGHLLVAAHALLRHKVGIRAAPSRRAVLVVDVYHQPVGGTLLYGLVQPRSPLLAAHLHEAELQSLYSPLFIQRQDAVELVI